MKNAINPIYLETITFSFIAALIAATIAAVLTIILTILGIRDDE